MENEKLSKKEKFRLEKRKEKIKKKIYAWTIFLILFLGIGFWIFKSISHSIKYSYPYVNPNDVPSGPIHWHPTLQIIIDGKNITIPSGIGLLPGDEKPMHTHENDGTIHIENSDPKLQPYTMSLGYFFYLWKKPFNSTCIFDYCTNKGELTMYVNGKKNLEYEKFVFKGEEHILIEYNSTK